MRSGSDSKRAECFTNVAMWALDYGRNPSDEARVAKKRAKLRPDDTEVAERIDL